MNKIFSTSLWSIGMSLGASAQIFYSQTFDSGFQNGGVIPDGSLNGWSDTRIVTEIAQRCQIPRNRGYQS